MDAPDVSLVMVDRVDKLFAVCRVARTKPVIALTLLLYKYHINIYINSYLHNRQIKCVTLL